MATINDILETADRASQRLKADFFREKQPERLRVAVLRISTLLKNNEQIYAKAISQDMGKTIRHSKEEIDKCAKSCDFFLRLWDHARVPERVILDEKRTAYIHYEPMGPVMAVMPWNFPFWQVIRSALPILLSGNPYILKHASLAKRSKRLLQSLFNEAGFLPGEFQATDFTHSEVEQALLDERVKGFTFTGSTDAGCKLYQSAAKGLKKCILELGGSDIFLVGSEATDIPTVVKAAIQGRLLSNGQSCIAAKRFLVHSKHYNAFRSQLIQGISQLRIGDPLSADTDLGPVSSVDAKRDLIALADDAKSQGANVTWLESSSGPGAPSDFKNLEHAFFQPCLIENISGSARLRKQEAFGPIFSLYSFNSRDEAVAIANETPFGLAGSIWTESQEERDYFMYFIESGGLHDRAISASDARVPFGGIKQSGIGKEMGFSGFREFSLCKTRILQAPNSLL